MNNSFVKIGAEGQRLEANAPAWDAVLDETTGLMWSAHELARVTQPEAERLASALKVAGFEDWRLPALEELETLRDLEKYDPAINRAFFPACHSDWYWTSTPAAYSPGGCAWCVYFYRGDSLWNDQDGSGFVRACRASQ